MDKTTETGMSPEAVAETVAQAVVYGEPDLTLAPFIHRMAIILRAVAPPLFFAIMAKRARKQKKDYVKRNWWKVLYVDLNVKGFVVF